MRNEKELLEMLGGINAASSEYQKRGRSDVGAFFSGILWALGLPIEESGAMVQSLAKWMESAPQQLREAYAKDGHKLMVEHGLSFYPVETPPADAAEFPACVRSRAEILRLIGVTATCALFDQPIGQEKPEVLAGICAALAWVMGDPTANNTVGFLAKYIDTLPADARANMEAGGAALIDHHAKVPISAAEREKMNTAEKLGREMMRRMFEKN